VHSPHVVTEIPVAWEAISCGTTLASLRCTQVWFVAMPVHSMSFPFVTEEASRGREAGGLACNGLASIRFQVRIHEFAARCVVSIPKRGGRGEGSYS
jgi:hypothetical protein